MSIIVLQKPSDIQPAQSPIVFSVFESGSNAYTASEFQYTANLYIWNGAPNQSGSYLYQARKFPNVSGSGIFDFGRFINSTLTDLSATNGSNIKYYAAEFGWQYYNGVTYVSQSGGLTPITCSTGGTLFKAYDGYALFPDAINEPLVSQSAYFPFMTDAGVVTQSVQLTDTSTLGNNSKGLSIWIGASDSSLPTSVACTASYSNGTQGTLSYALTNVGNVSSSQQVLHLPSSPGDSNWNTYWPTPFNLVSYVFNAYSGSTVLGTLSYKIESECYYTPVRVAYKNRFGQFDFINFYKRHNNTFNTDQRLYQPQLGSWEASTLSYNQFQTRQQRYIVDATEVIECNTGYLEEGYNELMKQLLVADEIYWLYDQDNAVVKPLTIQTNSVQFKTGVNNKLIQYTIVFDIGQPYKLIL
jgi:hypothetical protein